MATGLTARLEHPGVALVHLCCLLWVTLSSPSPGLWHHTHSLWICRLLSVLGWIPNLNLSSVLCLSLSDVAIDQSTQEANLQTSLVLRSCRGRSFRAKDVFCKKLKQGIYGRCSCVKDLHNSSKATASEMWSLGAPALAEASLRPFSPTR